MSTTPLYGRRLMLGALALFGLLGAGCSNEPSAAGTSTTGPNAAVTFAQCMRDNGVPAFPDPDASGQLTVDGVLNGSSIDSESASWKQAIDACKALEPSGFTGGGPRNAKTQSAALEFAQCIRDNGVADFPDPEPDAPLIDTNRIPSSQREGGMANLHAAMDTCGELAEKAIAAQDAARGR